MGKAVFHAGEFYIFGGETLSGPGATAAGVYNRVDIYNPSSNTWRQGADIPTGVHGIFPVLRGTQVLIATGGVQAASSRSTLFQIYNLG
jgi:N-acetylneuraminic acid mutarotase